MTYLELIRLASDILHELAHQGCVSPEKARLLRSAVPELVEEGKTIDVLACEVLHREMQRKQELPDEIG
jgi:hypothetical protein